MVREFYCVSIDMYVMGSERPALAEVLRQFVTEVELFKVDMKRVNGLDAIFGRDDWEFLNGGASWGHRFLELKNEWLEKPQQYKAPLRSPALFLVFDSSRCNDPTA
jgi:hypothetical protein